MKEKKSRDRGEMIERKREVFSCECD